MEKFSWIKGCSQYNEYLRKFQEDKEEIFYDTQEDHVEKILIIPFVM